MLSFTTVMIAIAFYWLFLIKTDPMPFNFSNINKHGISGLLLIIDLFIVAFPVRVLHLVYVLGLWALYLLFTLILHWTGVASQLYPVIKWDTEPRKAAIFGVCAVVLGSSIMHSFAYAIYLCRRKLARKLKKCEEEEEEDKNEEVVFLNQTDHIIQQQV